MFLTVLTRQIREKGLSLRHWLFISCAFSIVLVLVRMMATRNLTSLFMVWNLFLAFIPYAVSEWLFATIPVLENKKKLLLTSLVWLLFIPNSFYLITDLIHLENFEEAPQWFDLLLLFSFAWNGLMFGVLSVRKIEMIITAIRGPRFSFLFVFVVMWLNAFGIYLGRFLRFNSWDILIHPFSLFGDMLYILAHPIRHKMEWGMVSAWAIFITLFYFTIEKLGEHFLSRHRTKHKLQIKWKQSQPTFGKKENY